MFTQNSSFSSFTTANYLNDIFFIALYFIMEYRSLIMISWYLNSVQSNLFCWRVKFLVYFHGYAQTIWLYCHILTFMFKNTWQWQWLGISKTFRKYHKKQYILFFRCVKLMLGNISYKTVCKYHHACTKVNKYII